MASSVSSFADSSSPIAAFPNGIITVLNTPFDDSDRIDFRAIQKHVEYAAAAGVAGFLVPAMASEVYLLSREERKDIVRAVREACPATCTLIGGAGEKEAAKRRDVIEDLLAVGCTHVLLQIPYTDPAMFRREFGECHALGMEAIMLQDWDSGGGGLPLDLIVELQRDFAKFRALKVETVPSGPKYSRVLEATEGKLHVSGGWAVMQIIEAMDRGVNAFMPTAMHEIYVTIYNRYKAGNREGAIELFDQLLPIVAYANQHLDVSICFFKYMLAELGIYPTARVRTSSVYFDAISRKQAKELFQNYLHLRDSLSGVGRRLF